MWMDETDHQSVSVAEISVVGFAVFPHVLHLSPYIPDPTDCNGSLGVVT